MNIKKAINNYNLNRGSGNKMTSRSLGRLMFPGRKDQTVSQYMSCLCEGKRLSLLTADNVNIVCNVCDITPKELGIELETKQVVKL